MIYPLLKNFLFKLDAEDAHDITMKFMSRAPLCAKIISRPLDPRLALNVGSQKWGAPVGLAAGLDKNGLAYNFLSQIGFGAIEVGTVTPRPQEGNPKPRLFRYPEEGSLRNCMGFNNEGGDFLLDRVSNISTRRVPLGVNIGKNKITRDEDAYKDYASLYEKFKDQADYIVINVSSPNTPGLRSHQTKEALSEIFNSLGHKKGSVDLYVKIAPDITSDEITAICESAKEYDLTGIIATNTTIMPERGIGGISGDLLYSKARDVRRSCLDIISEKKDLEFIGVGGFSSYDQVVDFWRDGGSALQIYSAFIFQGPDLLGNINKKIISEIENGGYKDISELIASYRN